MSLKIKSILKESISLFLIFFFAFTLNSKSQTQKTPPAELGIYEHLDNFLPDDLVFTDENYNTVNLKDKIDKPTVIALVYYECPGLCSPLLEGVADVIGKAKLNLGSEYQVFTVSFDPTEKPKLAKDKKANYAKLVKNQDVKNGWTWFTGDSANIAKLLNAVGYKVKKEGKNFIHPASLFVVSPKGKITRYLHGTDFLPFDLKMAVIEASEGRSEPTINRVLQYCFSYDPAGNKYVLNITKVSGSVIILFAVLFFLGMLFSKKSRNRKSFNAQ